MNKLVLMGPLCRARLSRMLDAVIERTQDFTDSAYTTHEHREKILLQCDRLKLELNQLLRVAVSLVSLTHPPTVQLPLWSRIGD